MRLISALRTSPRPSTRAVTAINTRRMPLAHFIWRVSLRQPLSTAPERSASNSSGGAQPHDLRSRYNECAIDLVVVLADRRAGAPHRHRGFRKKRHHTLHSDLTTLVVRNIDDRRAYPKVRHGQ